MLWGQWDLHFLFIARGAEIGCLTLSPTKCHRGPAMYSSLLFYATSLMCLYNDPYVISAKATRDQIVFPSLTFAASSHQQP